MSIPVYAPYRLVAAGILLCAGAACGVASETRADNAGGRQASVPGKQVQFNVPGNFQDTEILKKINKAEEDTIRNKAFPLLAVKWPYTQLTVCWENARDEDATARQWVQDAIFRTWQKHSALTFLGWKPCTQATLGIRIRIGDTGPHVKAMGKLIKEIKNGMVLNFKFEIWDDVTEKCTLNDERRKRCIESIAVHEFGHAIGFAHEQNRADTAGECAKRKLKQGPDGDTIAMTPWDLTSAMNYCNDVRNNAGVLSEFDIKAVQLIYGAPK